MRSVPWRAYVGVVSILLAKGFEMAERKAGRNVVKSTELAEFSALSKHGSRNGGTLYDGVGCGALSALVDVDRIAYPPTFLRTIMLSAVLRALGTVRDLSTY